MVINSVGSMKYCIVVEQIWRNPYMMNTFIFSDILDTKTCMESLQYVLTDLKKQKSPILAYCMIFALLPDGSGRQNLTHVPNHRYSHLLPSNELPFLAAKRHE